MLAIDNLQYSLPILSSAIRLPIFWWKKRGKYSTQSIVNLIYTKKIYVYKEISIYNISVYLYTEIS